MGYRHERGAVLEGATALAYASGLHRLTFRSVGRHVGIPDRTVVYYFPTKEQLVVAVLQQTTTQLLQLLTSVVGEDTRPFDEILQVSWVALTHPDVAPALRLYVETLGLAAWGSEPYRSAVIQFEATWTAWFATRLTAEPGQRDERAAALVATLDGLLLLHVTGNPTTAATAARGLGLTP